MQMLWKSITNTHTRPITNSEVQLNDTNVKLWLIIAGEFSLK